MPLTEVGVVQYDGNRNSNVAKYSNLWSSGDVAAAGDGDGREVSNLSLTSVAVCNTLIPRGWKAGLVRTKWSNNGSVSWTLNASGLAPGASSLDH